MLSPPVIGGGCRHSLRSNVPGIGKQSGNEFLRGPKWRTRTSARRRATSATITFALIVIAGAALMAALMWLLDRLGSPTWLVVLPWMAPTLGALAWTLLRPSPAIATDDDDDSWVGYAIRFVLVGDDTPRSAPIRVLAALLFGAPIVWALIVSGLATLTGLF